MNISILCLGLGMIVLFFVACLFIRQSNKHIAELKKELEEAMERIDYIRKDMLLTAGTFNDEILKTYKELDNLKSKQLEYSENAPDLASHLKGIEGVLRGMLNIVVQEHTDATKRRYEATERQTRAMYEINMASAHSGDDDKPYADIPGDLDEGFEGEESATDEQREALEYSKVKYEWIFPSSDPSAVPTVGEEYLVIGRDREDNDIVTDFGTWKGLHFGKGLPGGFDMKEGYILDRVYAYVRLPSPSDVMNEVLDIRFKE